jgi:hypothetical protein
MGEVGGDDSFAPDPAEAMLVAETIDLTKAGTNDAPLGAQEL